MKILETPMLILSIALGIIPQIIQIIKTVEMPGNGAEKAATVLGIVKAAFELLPDEVRKLIGGDKVANFVNSVIDLTVKLLNVSGVFKK